MKKTHPHDFGRRSFLKTLGVGAGAAMMPALWLKNSAHAATMPNPLPFEVFEGLTLTSKEEIMERISGLRPMQGGTIPPDIQMRLGCTHVSGKYFFTKKPFLIEGAKKLHQLGYQCAKFWFSNINVGYTLNSEWKLDPDYTFVDLAKHPYFQEAFEFPFKTIALEVYPTEANRHKKMTGHSISPNLDFDIEETQVYDLTKYLLEKYRNRDVTFILQNWEGDWLMRPPGEGRTNWLNKIYDNLPLRVETMVKWFSARQRGVERARAEVTNTRCKVYHAVETNRVFDSLKGIATLTTHVLPKVKVDLISWSAYDGTNNGTGTVEASAVGVWQGIEIMQHCAMPTTLKNSRGKSHVMLGEFGVPEQRVPSETKVTNILDGALASCFAHEVPWMFYWELFCNEYTAEAKERGVRPPAAAEDLNGFWLIRPDGSPSYAGKYLQSVLRRQRPTI